MQSETSHHALYVHFRRERLGLFVRGSIATSLANENDRDVEKLSSSSLACTTLTYFCDSSAGCSVFRHLIETRL